MTRKTGDRNRDFEEQRQALIVKIKLRLAATDKERPSFRELARTAGVSVPTLRHYFGDRDGCVAAVITQDGRNGEPYLALVETTNEPFAQSIRSLTMFIAFGFASRSLVPVHGIGLQEGMGHATLGPTYLNHILEPTLVATEKRLKVHISAGEMIDCDVRGAALGLVAPLVLAGLHQTALGGTTIRPLDLTALARDIAVAFVRAHVHPGQPKPREV